MTVIITYEGNRIGFSQLLVSLQPQLHPNDDIYVLDYSVDKSAIPLVKLYGSTRCYLFVERIYEEQATQENTISYGVQSMKENKHEGALILSENCVISTTLVSNIKRASKEKKWDMIVPTLLITPQGHDMIDPNFKWFYSPRTDISTLGKNDVAGYCVYVKNKDKPLTKIGIIKNEKVAVVPRYS